jgi:predicted glycosyltransferase
VRIWVDLSNSPHVALFGPILERLAERGDDVLLSARDHAQTLGLAQSRWPHVVVVGGPSPAGRPVKAATIARRTGALARLAAGKRIDVALSHGSYAQIAAARSLGIPALTMMDYEFQPANHLSFRLARRVVVPEAFPEAALRRFGATHKTLRYAGYKEELYLAGFEPDASVIGELGLDPANVIVVLRPPPDGSLYHREQNLRFEEVARRVVSEPGVQAVLLTRTADRAFWAERMPQVLVPDAPIDGPSLVALADLMIGAGGTMNRESALLGTPTCTVFAGRLAAVDAALIADGRLVDLRRDGSEPVVRKKPARAGGGIPAARRDEILEVVERGLAEVSGRRRPLVAAAPAHPRRPAPARRRA